MTTHKFTIDVEIPDDADHAQDAEWWADAAAGALHEYGAESTYTLTDGVNGTGDAWTIKIYGEARDVFRNVAGDLCERSYTVRITHADYTGDAVIVAVYGASIVIGEIDDDGDETGVRHTITLEGLDEIYVY